MRDYGRISVSLWMSRKFRSLRGDDQARLLYLYLHTCPQANSIGCFALPKGYAMSDLGWNDRAINRAIKALIDASLIAWDDAEELVRIVGFLEHSPLTNLKHAKGAIKIALALPDCAGKISVCNDLLADPWAKNDDDLKRATIGLSKPSDTTETETETETDIEASSLRSDAGAGAVEFPNAVVEADFEIWWEQFPRYRRGPKGPVRKKFLGIVKRRKAAAVDLIAGLGRYNEAGYFDSEYACSAERWLNDERWTVDHFPPPGDKHTPRSPPPNGHAPAVSASRLLSMFAEDERNERDRSQARVAGEPDVLLSPPQPSGGRGPGQALPRRTG